MRSNVRQPGLKDAVAVVVIPSNCLVAEEGAPSTPLSLSERYPAASGICREVAQLVTKKGMKVAVTHGEGPSQDMPGPRRGPNRWSQDDFCVAPCQGRLGQKLQQLLQNELSLMTSPSSPYPPPSAVSVVSQVLVNVSDPAFQTPSVPVGEWVGEEEFQGCPFAATHSQAGWLCLLPAPKPIDVIEWRAVRTLLDSGVVPVAGGCGGVAVVENAETRQLSNVPARVETEYTGALLGSRVRARVLVLVVESEHRPGHASGGVGGLFGGKVGVSEVRRRLVKGDDFSDPFLKVKMEAAVAFLDFPEMEKGEREKRVVVVCKPGMMVSALEGEFGEEVLQVVPDDGIVRQMTLGMERFFHGASARSMSVFRGWNDGLRGAVGGASRGLSSVIEGASAGLSRSGPMQRGGGVWDACTCSGCSCGGCGAACSKGGSVDEHEVETE
uniref:Carbamate kinase n=1 Tax=Chromera velia CCMP2878 TaxID=1169474 RepID=A0A0G4HKW4_9ALVE|eukprot:Cvel_28584.t1-p1 / transcript=Cvel_28584.t1 / gene=Cvel_28584 / organism=Chromera_velia_CCMP2878 / gene_product=hypothetical protein / transcript_product=hypothetical protein / location=Cvel_scaffold3768:5725-7041(-) / protein_length=439 / sequence_SO=supercontig / SO=protein_coding / is_pseudo=false